MQRIEQGFLKIISSGANVLDKLCLFDFLRLFKKDSVIVLMYHGITISHNPVANFDHKHVEKEKFEEQLQYLKEYYELISLQDFMLWRQGKKKFQKPALMLTFDDGYKNCYTQLFPILKRYHIPAIIFLPTKYIGVKQPAWYDVPAWCIAQTEKQDITLHGKRLLLENEKQKIAALVQIKRMISNNMEQRNKIIQEIINQTGCDPETCSDENFLFMNWNECKEMQQNNIAFCSHSVTHTIMTTLVKEEVKMEVAQSKKEIEKQLKKPCMAFVYPFGSNNLTIKNIVSEEGYECAFTTTYGVNTLATSPFQLRRIALNNLYDLNIFKITLFVNFPSFHHWLLSLYSKIRRS